MFTTTKTSSSEKIIYSKWISEQEKENRRVESKIKQYEHLNN